MPGTRAARIDIGQVKDEVVNFPALAEHLTWSERNPEQLGAGRALVGGWAGWALRPLPTFRFCDFIIRLAQVHKIPQVLAEQVLAVEPCAGHLGSRL